MSPNPVTPLTIGKYLIGDREAILSVARSRNIVMLGGLLVLSAGFAREYDGEDLLSEPWHVFIPHAASLLTSFILYCMVRNVAHRRSHERPAFWSGYAVFLGLFWMTAPLAWVYAIPFERWMSPGGATLFNLRLLGLVSVWRVVLMTRVIQVVFGSERWWDVFFSVLLFGDVVMQIAISFIPVPVLQLMGGIRLTESEAILQSTVLTLRVVGIPALVVLLGGYLWSFRAEPKWNCALDGEPTRIGRSTWAVAIATILIWVPILPMTQPAQQRRRQVKLEFEAGRLDEALRVMSAHDRGEFPSHWQPPPHIALDVPQTDIADVVATVLSTQQADWVRDLYLSEFRRALPNLIGYYREPSEEQLTRYVSVLESLPVDDWSSSDTHGASEVAAWLERLIDEERYTEELRERLRSLHDAVDESDEDRDKQATNVAVSGEAP